MSIELTLLSHWFFFLHNYNCSIDTCTIEYRINGSNQSIILSLQFALRTLYPLCTLLASFCFFLNDDSLSCVAQNPVRSSVVKSFFFPHFFSRFKTIIIVARPWTCVVFRVFTAYCVSFLYVNPRVRVTNRILREKKI